MKMVHSTEGNSGVGSAKRIFFPVGSPNFLKNVSNLGDRFLGLLVRRLGVGIGERPGGMDGEQQGYDDDSSKEKGGGNYLAKHGQTSLVSN